jgi:hypothetical protein
MNYPLELNFKKFALSHQISVTDAGGTLIWYVKQKAFKLKEQVTVFGDREQTRPLYEIGADRVIDFSARYRIRESGSASELGVLQRRGMRSLWKAHYEIVRDGNLVFNVEEENPWSKVADALLMEVPLLGLLSGYVFHPRYLVSRPGGAEAVRLEKRAAFLQGRFTIERLGTLPDAEEKLALLSVMMIVLLEKRRG